MVHDVLPSYISANIYYKLEFVYIVFTDISFIKHM